MREVHFYYVSESQRDWAHGRGVRVCLQNTTDYSPFGVSLDGRTIAYQPAPAPTPTVSVVYQHKFDDGPNAHPYTTLPSTLDAKLTNISWTNTQNKWTNFNGFTGKAIAIDSALADTTRLFLNLLVNSGYKLDVTSYSFYHRSSSTGYSNYKLYLNNKLVGIGTVFVTSGSSLQFTGTQNVLNAISGLTGNVTVRLDLFGGLHGIAATFRMDNFTLNGYTQLIGSPNLLAKGYRYSINGQEKTDEIRGSGNHTTALFWEYDTRLGRRWNLDPKPQINISDYACFGINPIWFVDPLGDDKYKVDKEGNITLKRKTNKDYDKLVGSGSLFNRSIKVEKGTFENHNSGEVTNPNTGDASNYDTYSMSSKQGQKLFEFLSKNTDVEWGNWKLGEEGDLQKSLLSTSHNSNADMSSIELLKNPLFVLSINGHDHSHPGGSKIPSGSNMPLDMPKYRTGDVGLAKSIENYIENSQSAINRANEIIGGETIKFNKPVFRIYTAKDNKYTNYNGNTFIDNTIIIRPK